MLIEQLNVWDTALQVLERKHYTLSVSLDEDGDIAEWRAERDGFVFEATNPIALLGLVAIRDEVNPREDLPYWWSSKDRPTENVENRLVRQAKEEESRAIERSADPAWQARLREVMSESDDDLQTAAATLGIPTHVLDRILRAHRMRE